MGLDFNITGNNRSFMESVRQITAGMDDATRQIEANGGSIDRTISRIKNGVATLGIGLGFKELASEVANTRGEFQKLEVAFSTILQSEEKAGALMSQLVRTAATTPFDLKGVADGAKQLLATGTAAEEVNDILIRLGDVAAGLSLPLGDLIYLYSTTMTQGQMFTQDLRQFQGRGIPIAEELAKQFGVASDKVGELVTAGKVGAKEFKAAIMSMTDEGGKFGGLMEAQSRTISGQIANIEDAVDSMFNEIGKTSEGLINTSLSVTSSIVENWQTVVEILGTVAAAYGAQKAAYALEAGFSSAKLNYGYNVEIEQLQALLPLKEQAEKTDLDQAVASGRLTEARAAQIAALREEAKAQLESLAAKEAAAKAEEAAAVAKAEAAAKELADGEEMVRSYAEKLEAITQVGNAEEIEAALTELETAEALRNEAANLANAASEEARAAATNTAAASEARETLATQINTAQTASNTAATGILTIAKEKLAVAIAKVNAVMKANQFAIITGAVIALGYAVHKLLTYQTDYQKSLQKVSEATTETNIQTGKEIKALDELKAKLDTAVKGSDQWKATKDAIVKQFGQYIPQLDEEISKVGDLSTAYNDLKRAIQEANAAKGLKSFLDKNDNTEDVISKFREGIEDFKETAGRMSERGKAMLEPILREYAVNSSSDKNIFQFVQDKLKETYGVEQGGAEYKAYEYFLKRSNLKKITEAHKLNRSREWEIEKYASDMGISKDTLNEVRYGIEKPKEEDSAKDRSYWEKEVKNRKEAYEAILKTDKEGSAKARKAYEEAVAELDKYNSVEKKKTTGLTSEQLASKTEEETQQLIDLMNRQAVEKLRAQQEYEQELWQNRIDLMEEGEEKVLAQMQLNNEKERIALKEREAQAIAEEIARQKAIFDAQQDILASQDKHHARQVFDPKTVFDPEKGIASKEIQDIQAQYATLQDNLNALQAKAESDRLKASRQAMDAYLREFGSYQQKREAIIREYDAKINAATSEGERMQLTGQRNKAVSDLDYAEWIESGDIALAFGDISNLSDKTISRLIADMERYREKVTATFDPEKIREYEEALKSLRDVQAEDSFGIFASVVPDYFKQRKSVGDSMASAGANVNALNNQRNALLLKKSGIEGAMARGGNMSKELAEVNAELDANEQATKKAKNAFKLLQEQWDNLDSPEAKFYGICEAVASTADMVGGLANQAAAMADAMGAGGLSSTLGTLGEAMGSVQNVASGFAKGGLVGGIAAAAGEVMNWVGKLFAAGDKKHQRNIERLQDRIDALQNSYDKLGKAADDAFSTDASHLIDQQDTLLKQQKVLIKQQMAEEEAKKKTDKDKIKEYKERLEEIDETLEDNKKKAKEAIIGEDIKSAINDFAEAYSGAWDDGTDTAQKSMAAVKKIVSSALSELLKKNIQPAVTAFYDALAEAMEKGYLTDEDLARLDALKAQMDALAAKGEEQYKELMNRYRDLDEIKEELTDISFDSVRDNFKSKLLDMTADASDFTSDFTEMLREAMVEGLMDNKYDAMLKEWYDEFAEAMDNQVLSDEERDRLRQQYEDIINQGIADRNALNDLLGGGAYSQEASKGWAATMSQDTGDEMNGRLTAMVELQVINNDLQQTQNTIASQILATLQGKGLITASGDGADPTLLAIKDMMFLTTSYLEDIARYTKILYSVDERLAALNSTMDRGLI